jgi:Domain of unknown function (DUF5134)
MAGPAWLSAVVAATMLVIAAYCATRLVAARLWRRGIDLVADVNHLLMGVAMAGMLVPRLSVLPAGAWEAVFAGGCAWYGWQAVRASRAGPGRARPAAGAAAHSPAGAASRPAAGGWRCSPAGPHLAGNAAMVYMLAASRMGAPGGTGGGAMPSLAGSASGARYPVLALLFALFLIGYVAWLGDRLTSMTPAPALAAAPAPGGAIGPVLAPRASTCCRMAMGLAMGYMLVTMM